MGVREVLTAWSAARTPQKIIVRADAAKVVGVQQNGKVAQNLDDAWTERAHGRHV
jgi:hypothetical protein